MAIFIATVMVSSNPARAENVLAVSITGPTSSQSYPSVEAQLSVVDPASGRPVARIDTAATVVSDESGRLVVLKLDPVVSDTVPVAYSVLLDTGGAMAPYLGHAAEVLNAFVTQLGPNDVVRIAKFNDGVDEQGTNWVRRDDPNLKAQIATWQTTGKVSLVVPALVRSSEIARQAPQGFERHATVAFISVAGARAELGMTLDTIALNIPTTTFTFGFGQPPGDHEGLPFFLEDLAKQRGGTYWPVDSASYTGDGPKQVAQAMHGVWDLSFRADGLPDGQKHQFTVDVRDDLQRSGTLTDTYAAGSLLAVSPLSISGITQGERVGDDRKIKATLVGDKTWSEWRIELFKDCQPGTCSPSAEVRNNALEWRLVSGPLKQGDHRLYFRLTTSDGTREFTATHQLRFERAGTGWNLWIPIGLFGVALVGLAVVVGAGRKSRNSA